MWRYLVGMAAGVLLVLGGVWLWRTSAVAQHHVLPDAPGAALTDSDDAGGTPDLPEASEKTREQKRFSRSDHDKDGKIGRDEFLAARKRNFAKLDTNNDGVLSFDEYAAKAEQRFADADRDKSGALNPAEFATTKAPRKAKPTCRCTGQAQAKGDDDNDN